MLYDLSHVGTVTGPKSLIYVFYSISLNHISYDEMFWTECVGFNRSLPLQSQIFDLSVIGKKNKKVASAGS